MGYHQNIASTGLVLGVIYAFECGVMAGFCCYHALFDLPGEFVLHVL